MRCPIPRPPSSEKLNTVEGSLSRLGRGVIRRDEDGTPPPWNGFKATTIKTIHERSGNLTSYKRTGSSKPFPTNSPVTANRNHLRRHTTRPDQELNYAPPSTHDTYA